MTETELPSLADALIAAVGDLGRYAIAAGNEERWPLLRLGEREPIPSVVRRLVFERDGGCCLNCGVPLTIRTAQLDHIMPWSAGGSDTSDNLRILCKPCNEDRSNFRSGLDDMAAWRLPVTEICINCAHLETGDEDPLPVIPGLIHAYCGWCGTVSLTFRGWEH
jgi:hypothetical protein